MACQSPAKLRELLPVSSTRRVEGREEEENSRTLFNRVTSVRFGIQTSAPPFFDGTGPDLVVSGPNVGNNLGSGVLGSGTV